MKEIGGYFELELYKGQAYYNGDVLRLNTARNALEYLIQARSIRLLYLPYFTCDVLLEPLNKWKVPYKFYHIDELFEPIVNFKELPEDAYFLYTNYFGLKDAFIQQLIQQFPRTIIDNAQAFYSAPIKGVDTFYSPRKFFGLPDGGYLFTDVRINEELEQDVSFDRMAHLLKRWDLPAQAGYEDFKQNDAALSEQPIKSMSKLTRALLAGVDYKASAAARTANFSLLQQHLSSVNLLQLNWDGEAAPMVYPLLTNKEGLREKLIAEKIYCAQYWPNVLQWCKPHDWEYQLTRKLVCIPIDQRYQLQQLSSIIKTIKKWISE